MKELRNYNNGTASASGRLISGYAVRFDEVSVPIGGTFREVIAKNAIAPELLVDNKIEARFNHDPNKVLASNQDGTLNLELREDGLFYSFESPENELGDMLVNSIKEGKINASSFGFIIEPDDVTEYTSAGENFRTVTHIRELFDVSPVFNPAYTTTSCQVRKEDPIEEEVKAEEVVEEEKIEEKPTEEKLVEEEKRSENKEEIKVKKMKENKFNLLKAIRTQASGGKVEDAENMYFNLGRESFRSAGINPDGDIQIPANVESIETRAVTVSSEGEDVVETELMDIIKPLYAKNVLVQAGAKFYDGLVGDVQIPIMSQSNVTWEGETADAQAGDPTFTHVTLTPKRLTAYVDISKKLLNQDSVGVERNIRESIVAAINSKLEDTILGDASGNTTQPAGMFYGASVVSGVSSLTQIANIEEAVENANYFEPKKYVMNPKVKAAWRTLAKGQNINQSILNNGDVDGTPYLVTSHVPGKKFIYGDWSNLVIGQWGGIDLTVDNVTQATKGCVRLVINAYFDAKVLRSDAFQYGKID